MSLRPFLAIVLGTRPEIIKLAPVIVECRRRGIPYKLYHSGQHYDPDMDAIFFQTFSLPAPDYHWQWQGQNRQEQLQGFTEWLRQLWAQETPACVLVQGDTNTVYGAAKTADELGIPLAHIEAGLRSFDRSMPEELNRIFADQKSQVLFCPTPLQKAFLDQENIAGHIEIVGNTIADVFRLWQAASPDTETTPPILITLHRPANVDDPKKVSRIAHSVESVLRSHHHTALWPVHPRLRGRIKNPEKYSSLTFCDPMSWFTFVGHLAQAPVVLTDSGGVQEEACILGVPCLTLRPNSERQESLAIGANTLVSDLSFLETAFQAALEKREPWSHPYGDGQTSGRIIDTVSRFYLQGVRNR